MQSIVPAGRPMPDMAPSGPLTRINRYEDLRAGQYWRAKDDVPEMTKPQKRRRGIYLPKDHPDYIADQWSEKNRIGEEEYLVDVPVRSACPGGRIYLVRSLKLVDGDVHAVVMQGHPTEHGVTRTYLVDEFFACFEQVSEEEAQAVRDAEVRAIQDGITELQQAMIAGPPSEAPTALLGHQTRLPAKPSIGTMIANIDHIQSLKSTAENAVAIAERQSSWITTHSKEIAERTQGLVPFFQERASAALATTESVMRYATDLQKGVQSLGLYVGTDVEVVHLAKGESADPSEPLTIYRDMLYMDEEYVVHMDGHGRGNGADHKDFDDFVKAMVDDAELRDRVLPYPRMVVLMRYRNSNKTYVAGNTIEAAMANADYNKPNRLQFLLIRDGDNIWQVWSELTTQAISALYPTKGMGDDQFRGVNGESITISDLDMADAKTRFDDLNRVYKNLLLLLWGLNDRLGIFGSFYTGDDWSASGFLDQTFQHRRFRFWDPYGDTTMIGTGRPRFSEWIAEKNGWLRSGSRVVVTRSTLGHDGGFGQSSMETDQPAVVRKIGNAAYEFVARKTKKGHVVAVDAGRMVHPRERYKRPYYLKQTYDVVLNEERHGYSNGSLQWLCLDMVEASDIDHYLQSRIDRRSYMEFFGLLTQVRELLRREDAEMAPVIAKLEAAFAEAGVAVPEGTTARDVARHAIRLWRTAGRGRPVPPEGEEGHADAYKTLLNNMWTLAGNDHPVAEAERLAAREGRKPLRLVLTGRDRFALYATSVGDEIESRLFEHVWVTRLSCQRKGGELKVTSTRLVPMPDAVADEEVLHEWDDLAAWRGLDVSKRLERKDYYESQHAPYTYESIRRAFATAQEGSLEDFRTPPEDLGVAIERLRALRHRKTGKSGSVAHLSVVQPFAIIRRTAFSQERIEGFTSRYTHTPVADNYLVLSLQDDAFRMLARTLDDEADKNRVREAFASQYNDKTYQRVQFDNERDKAPLISTSILSDWSKAPADPYARDRTWRGIPLEANWSENVRSFDVQTYPSNHIERPGGLWSPKLDEMLVWIDPKAPAILNELCARHGWGPVPFVAKPNR